MLTITSKVTHEFFIGGNIDDLNNDLCNTTEMTCGIIYIYWFIYPKVIWNYSKLVDINHVLLQLRVYL